MPKSRKPGTVSASKSGGKNKYTPMGSKKSLVKVSAQPLKGLIKKKRSK